jgi:hypothetical protein
MLRESKSENERERDAFLMRSKFTMLSSYRKGKQKPFVKIFLDKGKRKKKYEKRGHVALHKFPH